MMYLFALARNLRERLQIVFNFGTIHFYGCATTAR